MRANRLTFCIAALALSGVSCVSLLPQRATSPEGRLPESFSEYEAQTERSDRWWEVFESDELTSLVQEALSDSLTLREMWARLDQAGAAATIAAAGRYPELSLESGASYERRSTTVEGADAPSVSSQVLSATVDAVTERVAQQLGVTTGGGSGTAAATTSTSNTRVLSEIKQFSFGLAAGYEIDLWGRVAAGHNAARLNFEASRDDLEAAAMTVAGEVVDRWLRIIELRAQKQLLAQQLETSRTYLELVDLRFRSSLVSALDVYQQRQVVADIEKQIPLIESSEQVLLHELAVLLGKPPGASLELGEYDLETVPPLPAAGLPAELLINRPDIRAARKRLEAADNSLAAARADQLPAISLTGRAAYQAGELEFLLDDWFANLAANLTAPLFDGSRRAAEVRRNRAVIEERLAAYRAAVLAAIKEVEDALVTERMQHRHIAALEKQIEYADHALQEAEQRYRKGLNDYLPVLTSLQTTQRLTRSLVEARRNLLVYRVRLYRALGGNWTDDLERPALISEETQPAEIED